MLSNTVTKFLNGLKTLEDHIPSTLIYNEGWLLRCILNWFYINSKPSNLIYFFPESTWFSEGLLPSKFIPMFRGDQIAEGRTNADGVVGNIKIGSKGKGDVSFVKPFEQLIVTEAKIYSKLSYGTKNANFYDQAARNVGCVAKMLDDSNCYLKNIKDLAFYVIAPKRQIKNEPSFSQWVNKTSIEHKVQKRIKQYKDRKDYNKKEEWFKDYFLPVLSIIKVECISWEKIIKEIKETDNKTGNIFENFYKKCLEING